jgi:hypothetical protein
MIRISCTNCKTILSIDDAFAGGVCRCQHCGTIQTVPAQARGNATVAVSGHSIGGQKSLYQNGEPSSVAGGTGLDDLASVVVSSGLTSSRLTRSSKAAEQRSSKSNLLVPVLIGSGVIVLILMFVIFYLVMHSPTAPPQANTGGTAQGTDQGVQQGARVTTGPNFCGTALTGNTIIYVLDRGQASKDFLGELKEATLKSLGTLSADRKFEILFWTEGSSTPMGYPDNTTAYATKDSIASAGKAIEDVTSYGSTDVKSALLQAVAQHPDEIIIATPKGLEFNAASVDDVMALRGTNHFKIDTFFLRSNEGESEYLQNLARQTGGTYHSLTKAQLRADGQ